MIMLHHLLRDTPSWRYATMWYTQWYDHFKVSHVTWCTFFLFSFYVCSLHLINSIWKILIFCLNIVKFYVKLVLFGAREACIKWLQGVQNKAARLVFACKRDRCSVKLVKCTTLILRQGWYVSKLCCMYTCVLLMRSPYYVTLSPNLATLQLLKIGPDSAPHLVP